MAGGRLLPARQHRPALPAYRLHQLHTPTLIACIGLLVTLSSAARLPIAYVDREDIISAVTEGLEGIPDREVYVYYGAQPAVDFHFPGRRFVRGKASRGNIQGMGEEILALARPCNVSVLFSHVMYQEDRKLLAFLEKSGLHLIGRHAYRGTSVARFSRCVAPRPRSAR